MRQNYGLFLDASNGIATVGNDMTMLKELVVKTQALVEVNNVNNECSSLLKKLLYSTHENYYLLYTYTLIYNNILIEYSSST